MVFLATLLTRRNKKAKGISFYYFSEQIDMEKKQGYKKHLVVQGDK